MSRRPARFTKAEAARAIQAARESGAGPVRFLTDGTILIDVAGKPEQGQGHETETNEWDSVT